MLEIIMYTAPCGCMTGYDGDGDEPRSRWLTELCRLHDAAPKLLVVALKCQEVLEGILEATDDGQGGMVHNPLTLELRAIIDNAYPIMRVLICGDRNWKDKEAIFDCVAALPESVPIIEGEARGADRIAGEAARLYGHMVWSFPADWNKWGKAAGPIRNLQMLKEGKPSIVVFFHNNLRQSKGTKDMVERATRFNIPVINGRSVSDWPRAFELYADIAKAVL